jgi:hypothetical protein
MLRSVNPLIADLQLFVQLSCRTVGAHHLLYTTSHSKM